MMNYLHDVSNAVSVSTATLSERRRWKIILICISDKIVRLIRILVVVIVEVGSSERRQAIDSLVFSRQTQPYLSRTGLMIYLWIVKEKDALIGLV